MERSPVDERNGGYYVAGTRISLDSIVTLFNEGMSPAAIQEDYPALSLEQIEAALAYYLDHREQVDENIRKGEAEAESLFPHLSVQNPALYERMMRSCEAILASHP